jgi:hypothetical protein
VLTAMFVLETLAEKGSFEVREEEEEFAGLLAAFKKQRLAPLARERHCPGRKVHDYRDESRASASDRHLHLRIR